MVVLSKVSNFNAVPLAGLRRALCFVFLGEVRELRVPRLLVQVGDLPYELGVLVADLVEGLELGL